MNEVITKLYEIEEKAGQILDEARTRKDALAGRLEQDKAAYTREQQKVLDKRLCECRTVLEEQTKKDLARQEETCHEQLKQLDRTYDEHLSELAQVIFKRMTEV